MRASKRSLKGLLALTILAAVMLPGVAGAASPPPVADVIVFGNKMPDFAPWGVVGDPGWNDPVFGYNSLFANSKPFDQASFGGAYFMGVATPDTIIDIEITDGAQSLFTATWTAPTGSTQAIDGYDAGWFGLHVPSGFPKQQQNDLGVVYPTMLGVHKAETDLTINPDGSASTNPAHWGPSTITFKFTARNPATNEVSGTVTRQITKYAGTPDDVTAPGLLTKPGGSLFWPPEHWCHLAGRGANDPFTSSSLGGRSDGYCSDFAAAPFGAIPDITWLFCINLTSEPLRTILGPNQPIPTDPGDNGPLDPVEDLSNSITEEFFTVDFAIDGDGQSNDNGFRGFYCSGREGEHTPTGEARIQGFITDVPGASRGIGSEIANISVQVFRGANLWLDLTPNVTVGRAGPMFTYETKLRIQDVEPNYPLGELYKVTVSVTDAWGRAFNSDSPEITVYPY